MNSFTNTGLKPEILKPIKELWFEKPTPIQAQTIPHLMSSNQDWIGSAQTGTGKTAAFELPSLAGEGIADKKFGVWAAWKVPSAIWTFMVHKKNIRSGIIRKITIKSTHHPTNKKPHEGGVEYQSI